MPLFRAPPTIGLTQPVQKKRLLDSFNRPTLKTIIDSNYFSNGIMLVILMNAVTIGLDAQYSLNPYDSENRKALKVLDGLDYLFFFIYFVEFILKLYVYQMSFWKSSSYVFELLILVIMLIQLIIVGGGLQQNDDSQVIVDILNIFKAVRIFRAVILFEGVQVLLNALLNTVLKSAGSVSVLLIMLWIFFAVVGYYSFGYDDSAGPIYEEWGTLGNAVISLLTFLFAEGWVQIQKGLNDKFSGSEYFAIIFITFAHFIFINLFIGIIIMNIHDATERYNEAQRKEREMQLQLKKEYLYKRQHDDVHKMLEKQKHTNYGNFQELTKGIYKTLSNVDYVLMSDVCSNLMWLETFIDSLQRLDMYTFRAQQCHRNLSAVLAEMAERHYQSQYGLSNPAEFLNNTFDDSNEDLNQPCTFVHVKPKEDTPGPSILNGPKPCIRTVNDFTESDFKRTSFSNAGSSKTETPPAPKPASRRQTSHSLPLPQIVFSEETENNNDDSNDIFDSTNLT